MLGGPMCLQTSRAFELRLMDLADDLYAAQPTFGTVLQGYGLAVPKTRFYCYLTFLS